MIPLLWDIFCSLNLLQSFVVAVISTKKKQKKRKTLSFVRRLSVICCRRTINITEDSQPRVEHEENLNFPLVHR